MMLKAQGYLFSGGVLLEVEQQQRALDLSVPHLPSRHKY